MKTMGKVLAGWTAGIAVGWCLAGFLPTEIKEPEVMATKASASFPILAEDGQVRIDRKELSQAKRLSATAGLSCDHYARPGSPPPVGPTPLTHSLGLNSQQVDTFHRIFQQAAEARLAWEKENARVKDISPGEWEIQIPGDGGEADRELMEKLTAAFGSELAGRIELSADLDGFFNLAELDADFRHGTLRLRTRREEVDRDNPLASVFGREDRFRVAVESENKVVTFHLADGSLQSNQLSWRLGRLIGGDEALRDSAPVHVMGGNR